MKTSFLMVVFAVMGRAMLVEPKAESLTEVDGQLVANLGVPMPKQIEYIRELSRFFFTKARWFRRFRANACPEFTKEVEVENKICPMGTMPPLRPLIPLVRCDLNKNAPDCDKAPAGTYGLPGEPGAPELPGLGPQNGRPVEGFPQTNKPPIYCDLEANRVSSECLKSFDCEKTPDILQCKPVSKCDTPQYAALPECVEKKLTCAQDSRLCLTVCDTPQGKGLNECLVEKCQWTPNTAFCKKVLDCTPKPVCTEADTFTKKECCPNHVCPENCETTNSCPPPPPPVKCEWGYKVGKNMVKLLEEPVKNQKMDSQQVLEFIECFTKVTQEKESELEVKCFYDGLEDGYIKVSEEEKEQAVKSSLEGWQKVEVIKKSDTDTVYKMKSTETKILKA